MSPGDRGEPLEGTARKSTSKRTLQLLPGHKPATDDLRSWLTAALDPPDGYRVVKFERSGRQKTDPCELTLSSPSGGRVSFRFAEQRELSTPSALRANVLAMTDGLCRVAARTRVEQEDMWAALCLLARVLVEQDARDEMREWLIEFVELGESVTGLSFEPRWQLDALLTIKQRPQFTYQAAFKLRDPNIDPEKLTRPAVITDSVTGTRWVRTGELATYLRHVIGVGQMSQPTIDGRMAEIGGERHTLEVRRGRVHPKLGFYRLPDDLEGDEPTSVPQALDLDEQPDPTVPSNPSDTRA